MNQYMRYDTYEWALSLDGVLSEKYLYNYGNSDFDRERMLHSLAGKGMTEAAAMRRFSDPRNPALKAYWEERGLCFQLHTEEDGQQWMSFVPKGSLEQPERKIPLVLCFSKVEMVTFEAWYHLILMAAQGDFVLLCYTTESVDENNRFLQFAKRAAELWPVDLQRIYTIGHSHYGRFALQFALRNRDVAGVMQSGSYMMLCPLLNEVYPDMLPHDLPIVHVTGMTEHNCPFPICGDASGMGHVPQWILDRGEFPWDKEHRFAAWQRRQRFLRCPVSSMEEVEEAMQHSRVSQKMGLKADAAQVLYMDGVEYYIADIKNLEGKSHFRAIGVENMPHFVYPGGLTLSFSYIRRFARDLQTGESIELYQE